MHYLFIFHNMRYLFILCSIALNVHYPFCHKTCTKHKKVGNQDNASTNANPALDNSQPCKPTQEEYDQVSSILHYLFIVRSSSTDWQDINVKRRVPTRDLNAIFRPYFCYQKGGVPGSRLTNCQIARIRGDPQRNSGSPVVGGCKLIVVCRRAKRASNRAWS